MERGAADSGDSALAASSAARRNADAIGSAILGAGCQGNFAVPLAAGGAAGGGAADASSSSTSLSSAVSASRMPSKSASSTSATCVEAAANGSGGGAWVVCAGSGTTFGLGDPPENDGVPGALHGDGRDPAAGLAGGVAKVEGAVEVVLGAVFPVSPPLRNKPRATRSVPFACSTLMGLVRTRFAPIRKAFATPACPSTTATANDDWFAAELRALLNSNVAFCSLSQSTTTASKCCAINFLTAANGSVHGSTVKSRSLRTCATKRALFSSGQKSNAW